AETRGRKACGTAPAGRTRSTPWTALHRNRECLISELLISRPGTGLATLRLTFTGSIGRCHERRERTDRGESQLDRRSRAGLQRTSFPLLRQSPEKSG